MKKIITSTLLLILLISCSTISKNDCKKDMELFGLEHGSKGMTNYTDEIRNACITSNSTVDLEKYEKGFQEGWKQYCTSYNGYMMGKSGGNYRSFCPPNREDLFKEKFLIGKQVYELTDREHDLLEKVQDLQIDAKKSPAMEEEFKKAQFELSELRQEIFRLEQLGKSKFKE